MLLFLQTQRQGMNKERTGLRYYDKRNISMVACDRYSVAVNQNGDDDLKNFDVMNSTLSTKNPYLS